MNPQSLTGKTALVTGASRGVGASVATLLGQCGADVGVNYRSKRTRAEAVANRIRASGRRAVPLQADITSERETDRMMAEFREAFGILDLLILNASGGLEKDKDNGYAMRLNRGAQIRAVDLACPTCPRAAESYL